MLLHPQHPPPYGILGLTTLVTALLMLLPEKQRLPKTLDKVTNKDLLNILSFAGLLQETHDEIEKSSISL
jgi:hypothetical protein